MKDLNCLLKVLIINTDYDVNLIRALSNYSDVNTVLAKCSKYLTCNTDILGKVSSDYGYKAYIVSDLYGIGLDLLKLS